MEKYETPTYVIDRVLRIRKRHLDAVDEVRKGDQSFVPLVRKYWWDAICILREHGYTNAQAEMTFSSIKRARVE